jgi:hypothetical protein
MKIDILIRSYKEDLKWLKYSLKSIHKFFSGYQTIHLVVPEQDFHLIEDVSGVEKHKVSEPCGGYLSQQYTKLCADEFCTADFVLHVDSDVIFTKPATHLDLFTEGKPILVQGLNIQTPWRAIAAQSLGWEDEYEYMRTMPLMYPRSVYPEFRAWMEEKHNMPLYEHICKHPQAAGDQGWSEFQALGQWCKKYHKDKFAWTDPDAFQSPCVHFWSWGGITDRVKTPPGSGHPGMTVEELENLLA